MKTINNIIELVGWEAIKLLIGLIGVLVVVVVNALVLTWAERKVSGHMQRRIGPKGWSLRYAPTHR